MEIPGVSNPTLSASFQIAAKHAGSANVALDQRSETDKSPVGVVWICYEAHVFGCPQRMSLGGVFCHTPHDCALAAALAVRILFSPAVNPYVWSVGAWTRLHSPVLITCPLHAVSLS